MKPTHCQYESNGLSLHYVAWGQSDAPTVIIHHGFMDQCRAWDPVARSLCNDFRIIVVDARGHGDSDWVGRGGSYYFPDYIYDLQMLIQTLECEKVALLGHSMGGAVVTYYGGSFPEKVVGIVNIEGLGPPKGFSLPANLHMQTFIRTTHHHSERRTRKPMESVEYAATRIQKADILINEELALVLARHATRAHPEGGVSWKYDPLHRARSGMPFLPETAAELWRNITVPVLHIQGQKSGFKLDDMRDRSSHFCDFREVSIDDAGHNLHAHRPQALVDVVRPFLNEQFS